MAKRCISLHATNLAQLPQHNFEETPFFVVEGEFVEHGFDVTAPPDIEFKPDFPNCCGYHAGLLAQATDWFGEFPKCCPWHQELARQPWFSLASYAGRPLKILLQTYHTTHHMEQHLSAPDWYEDITEYIDYNVASFGSPTVGGTQYLGGVEDYVKAITEDVLPPEKRRRLLDYLDQQPTSTAAQRPDLNQLYGTFQKWLSSIPALPAFADLKADLAGKVPVDLLLYAPQHNRYLGQTAYKARTRSQLVDLLLDFTKGLLAGVQSAKLVREGLITDLYAHQVHLLGEWHRLRQSSLVAHYSKGEGKYLRLLTKWLRNEEAYFAALLLLLPGAGSLPGAAPAGSFSALPMNTSQKLQKLEQALSQATVFKESPGISAAFTAWQDATYRTLAQLYGAAAFESTRFRELRFAPRPGTRVVPQTPDHQERRRKAFQRDLHIAVESLTSYIADLSTDMTSTEQLIDAGAPPTSRKRVFISHATTDAAVVDELLDILGVLGLGSEHVFCSSVAGYGIPLGENFYERLRLELTADVLVLFVLSPNFFKAQCVCVIWELPGYSPKTMCRYWYPHLILLI